MGIDGLSGRREDAWVPSHRNSQASFSDADNMLLASNEMAESAGLSVDLLNSWNLNPLELDQTCNHAAAMYFLGFHSHGVYFDPAIMSKFLETVEAGYLTKCAYHTWFHAIDVTHGVYRFLRLWCGDVYLSTTERCALLISAVGHDTGHPGLNNLFLVETSHELALLYNDMSPLENMHSAKLFELLSQPECNVFGMFPRQQLQELRNICISVILHTDNTKHFAMIKEVQMLYEVNSEMLDASPEAFRREAR